MYPVYQDFEPENFHIEVLISNKKYDIGFMPAILKECGVDFELDNPPVIDSVDDLVKCLNKALKHKLNNSKGEPVECINCMNYAKANYLAWKIWIIKVS